MVVEFVALFGPRAMSDFGWRCAPKRTSADGSGFMGSRLVPLGDIDVIAARHAGVKLARTADLLVRVLDHLAPLADPADGAGDREQHGEHRGREAHRLQRDARIEVDIRIKLAVDEIGIAERDLFQFKCYLQHRIVAMAGLPEPGATNLLP